MTEKRPPSGDNAERAGFSDRIRARPRRWVLGVAVVSLLLGTGIGVAGSSDADRITALQSERDRLGGQADARAREITRLEGENEEQADMLSRQDERIDLLTAEGDVPNFVGIDVSDAQSDEIVDEYRWRIETSDVPSDAPIGEVLEQSPAEGESLKRGRTIRLGVAVERPKEWVTIQQFSGSGEKKSDEFRIPAGVKVRVQYSFSGDSNAILDLGDPNDEWGGEGLLNEIGDYSDVTRVYGHSGLRYIEACCGTWDVAVQVFK